MRGQILVIAVAMAWHVPALAHADGGTVRSCEVHAGRRITVFTAPTFLRAGPMDVSVLVQDAASGKPLLDVPIVVSAYPITAPHRRMSAPATTAAATNQLLHVAQMDFPEAGNWHIEIVVAGQPHETAIGFDVVVAPPSPPWLEMSLWIGWPLAAIGFFAIHHWLVRRRRSLASAAAKI